VATRQPHLRAYGLTIASEFNLPELPTEPDCDEADVRLDRESIEIPAGVDPDQTVYRRSPEELLLLFDAATISIRDGRELRVDPDPAVPEEVLRHLIVGPAFNFLLHQRGYFVLHASTVAIDGCAVAFVGRSGAGKTTTAGAFLRAGHRVLSDDVAALDLNGDSPRVQSGYPAIKLDPAVVEQLEVPVGRPPETSPHRDRHFHPLTRDQPAAPVPLRRVYRLEDAPRAEIRPIESGEQVTALVRNTYTARLLAESNSAVSNFRRCSSLADSVPVKRLRRRRELSRLPRLVELVEEDLDGDDG
jgi:hypothetical protein